MTCHQAVTKKERL